MEINAFGQEQRVVSRVPPIPGRVIRSTIDLGLQTYAEQRLAEQPISESEMIRAGAAVVMKVDTGEVLAMASHPTFDQSIFTSRITNSVWNELINDEHKPLVNKCSAEHYPPGSTYKMVTMLAAMELGISPREQVTCSGKTEVGHRGRQIIANRFAVAEEAVSHHRTHSMQTAVLRTGIATPVPEKPGHRIMRTGFQFAAQNILLPVGTPLASVHACLLSRSVPAVPDMGRQAPPF